MTKGPRGNRVPVMMSESELQAIDDWRYENRVATRSDAIRRLTHLAIYVSPKILEMEDRFSIDIEKITSMAAKVDWNEVQPTSADYSNLVGAYLESVSRHLTELIALKTVMGPLHYGGYSNSKESIMHAEFIEKFLKDKDFTKVEDQSAFIKLLKEINTVEDEENDMSVLENE